MKGRVYKLIHPLTKEPMYVGSTKKNLTVRMWGHIGCFKFSKSALHEYLAKTGIRPIIVLLEEVDFADIHELRIVERKWILRLRQEGANLFNKVLPSETKKNYNGITIRFSNKNKYIIGELMTIADERGVSLNYLVLEILSHYVAKQKLKAA